MKSKGTIKQWNADKGYGFVKDAKSLADIFIHISDIEQKWVKPRVGEPLSYTISVDASGKQRAVKARFTQLGLTSTGAGKASIVFCSFFLLIASLIFLGKLPLIIIVAYGLMSLLSFLCYWIDKRSAQASRSRIPEARLHLLGLLFGWPGANLAQQLFRHKSVKFEFRIGFYFSVVFNLLFVGYLLTPEGAWLNQTLSQWNQHLGLLLQQTIATN